MAFNCSGCGTDCCWHCRKPVEAEEIKTIGNMFCNAESCVLAGAQINGITVEMMQRTHDRQKEPCEHTA
jgi:hypothetical protein